MTGSTLGDQSHWDAARSRNVLSPENLELVRQELLNGGVIFGWHYFYGGGRSGDMFCFSDYESYHQALLDSRPGDHFTVYSRNKLAAKALSRLAAPRSDRPVLNAHLTEVKNALAAGKEVAFLWCCTRPEDRGCECDAEILWDLTDRELEESLGLGTKQGGEYLFFLMETLDADVDGNTISSVSPGAQKRINALVDAKRPNEAGLTPVSGPY